jgi:hypothetical protein
MVCKETNTVERHEEDSSTTLATRISKKCLNLNSRVRPSQIRLCFDLANAQGL